MKTVLVTGHLGFIGKYLTVFLESLGNTVIGIDIKEGHDILTADLPECDIVIHLAAASGVRQSVSDPAHYWKVNVEGTKRILDFYASKRVLVASSSAQYEPHLNPYAASKHVTESIPHRNVCFMRFHTVYSDTPRENMFFYKLLSGTLEYVTTHERDFVHISDICNAIHLLMDHTYTGALDIGTGNTIKIADICPALPIKHNTPHERHVTKANTTILSNIGYTTKINVVDFIADKVRR